MDNNYNVSSRPARHPAVCPALAEDLMRFLGLCSGFETGPTTVTVAHPAACRHLEKAFLSGPMN